MTLETLIRYLFLLDRDAILAIAADASAPITGALLVLSAAIARNHARHDLLAQPWRLLTPFAASLVTAAILFFFLQFRLWMHAAPLPPIGLAAWSFLGLYWATAPLAWLYGLPFEWLFGIERAARARLWVLGVVSAWRIALITRVLAILLDDNWWSALAIVMLVESAIALAALVRFHTAQSNLVRPRVSSSLIDAMGGLMLPPEQAGTPPAIGINSPELEHLTIEPKPFRITPPSSQVAGNVVAVSIFGVFIGLLANFPISPTAATWSRFVSTMSGTTWMPAWFALAAVGFWLLTSLLTQPAQRRKSRAERLFAAGRSADAIAHLASLPRSAFPASWEPPPSEDFRGTPSLLSIMEALAAVRPAGWVAESYAPRINHYVSQPVWYWHYREDAERLCAVLEQLPNSRSLAIAALAGLDPHEKTLENCRRLYAEAANRGAAHVQRHRDSDGPYVVHPQRATDEPDHAVLRARLQQIAR